MDIRTTPITIDGVEGVFISLEDFQQVSALDVPDDITDPSDVADYFWDNAEFPTLSANASGWGRNWSLDLGDQWEPVEENGEPLVVDE